MKKIIILFKNKKAESQFSLLISFMVIMTTFVAILLVLPIFTRKQDLDHFANTILRQAEIDGTVDQTSTYNYLCNMYNMTPTITWEWDKYQNSKKVQLNKKIKVTLEDEYLYDVGGVLKQIKIPLKSTVYGKSEVYWK